MTELLHFIGLVLVASWIGCVVLPFYVMYKLVKSLAELHNETEEEGD